jgi:NAD(P)-dependent dehydrogenase (short-subunit alcohol dehydrogenase family)
MSAGERFLAEKVALVTGSSSGAGVEIARELARAGARVAVHYRRGAAGAAATVEAIAAEGGEARAFQADVAAGDEVRRLVDGVGETLGPVSILVNNAGPFADTPLRTLAERDWDYVMDANLKAVWLAAQRVAPGMEGWAGGAS